MLHTRIIPRIHFEALPIPGVTENPLPPILPTVDGGGVAHAWAVLYANLLGLHALYGRIGVVRPLGRLHDVTTAMYPVVLAFGGVPTVRACLSSQRTAIDALDDERGVLAGGREAGWWVAALQSSLALSCWYELAPEAEQQDADFASHVSTTIRRVLASVYERQVADAIQDAAHGDGEGDLLAQVVANALDLGAPLQGIPEELAE